MTPLDPAQWRAGQRVLVPAEHDYGILARNAAGEWALLDPDGRTAAVAPERDGLYALPDALTWDELTSPYPIPYCTITLMEIFCARPDLLALGTDPLEEVAAALMEVLLREWEGRLQAVIAQIYGPPGAGGPVLAP